MTVWIALCQVAMLAAALPGDAGEPRYCLRGRVIDAVNGRPLADVHVGLSTADWQSEIEPVVPDSEGRFLFTGLAAGEFVLTAHRPDFQMIPDELPDPHLVQTVSVGPEPENEVVFRVMPRGVISGTVRDESGDFVAGAEIAAYRPVWSDGRVALQLVAQDSTDDRGRYRMDRLRPAGYVVCASPQAERLVAPQTGSVDFVSRDDLRIYAQSCFPNATASSGRVFTLLPGVEASIDLTLLPMAGLTVRGKLVSLPKGATSDAQLVAGDKSGRPEGAFVHVADTGDFVIAGLVPGRYLLAAEVHFGEPDAPGLLIARLPMVLHDSLEGVVVPLEAPVEVGVAWHGIEKEELERGDVTLGLLPYSESSQQTGIFFRWSGGQVISGRYWLTSRTRGSTCVASAKLGDTEVSRSLITVKPGTPTLDVTISHDCGAIHARVLANGKAAARTKVLLLLSGTPEEPGQMITDFTDDAGEIWFTGLAPEHYLMWAWNVNTDGSFVGPPSLAEIAAQATPVVVGLGEPARVDIALLRVEGAR